jgi:hypothetical protein
MRPEENDMFTKATVLTVGFSALLLGCGMDQAGTDDSQEIIDNLLQVGFPAEEIRLADGLVYVGNDAVVTLQASREMLQPSDSTEEQYRTTNLVGGPNPSTICVNGAAFAGNFSTGLNNAIGNYNAVFNGGGFRLRFQRVNGGPVAGCTFFINGVIQAGLVGGSAGFPSGGAPFGQINIGGGLSAFSVDVIEHVITHELGHCIGFRHSDWFNRAISCGAGGAEPNSPPGAILIPGTPAGAVVGGSIMNACFRSVETGEFTGTDITALRNLY